MGTSTKKKAGILQIIIANGMVLGASNLALVDCLNPASGKLQ